MWLFFGLFMVLILGGMSIPFALCIPSLAYLLLNDIPTTILAQRLTQSLNSFPLLAIPLFIMAGRLMNGGGITRRIFKFANNLVGFIPGGLGHVNVLSSVIFAGMSGVAIADIGGLGQIEIEAMRNAKYPDKFTAGVTAASAIIGPIIPPSIPVILFSIASEASVLAIFMGGILPGILIAILLMITVYIYAVKYDLPVSPRPGWGDIIPSFVEALPPLLAPVLMIGGMLMGVFSPTEAAGVTVLYSLVLSVVVYRDLTAPEFMKMLRELLADVAKLGFIIAASMVFSWILIIEQLPQGMVAFLGSLTDSKWLMLLIISGFFLVIGCFMEATIVFLVIAPMFVPTLKGMGISEIHFGIITVVAMGIGMYTPPVGIALYMIQDMCDLTFEDAVKAMIPFLVPLLVALLIIVFVPDIVMFIPNSLGLGR